MTDYASWLHQLQERFVKRLADDLQQIEKIAAGNLSTEQLMCLTQLAHKLAGISGSVGFADKQGCIGSRPRVEPTRK